MGELSSDEKNKVDSDSKICTNECANLNNLHVDDSKEIRSQQICIESSKLPKFTAWDSFCLLYSIGTYLSDVGSDVFLSYLYYRDGDAWFFGLTISFVIIPTIIMTIFSLRWYMNDRGNKMILPASRKQWILRFVLLTLQLGPLLRYIDALYYGCQCNKKKPLQYLGYYQQMVYESADASALRLFESFLEAAPQLVLQLYILSIRETDDKLKLIGQWTSVAISLISMSGALAGFQRTQRQSLVGKGKKKMTWSGTFIQFWWFIFSLASRFIALSLFASVFKYYIGLVCALHWFLMFIWIRTLKTDFCNTKCEEVIYNMVLGVMYIFCYVNAKDTPTRYRWIFFYAILLIENTALVVLWFLYSGPVQFKLIFLIIHYISFFLGLVLMVTYYLCFHPSRNIPIKKYGKKTEYPLQDEDGQVTVEMKEENVEEKL